ncbi:MAG: CYTH domain-containing protein [Patescibacteria group bacterium]
MENSKIKRNIEVELRSLLDEKQFFELKNCLAQKGKDLGEDNKDSHFFIFPDKLLKVTDNITKNNAKITLKLQKIGLGNDFEEIEVYFPREDADKIIRIFGILGFKNYMYSYQNRHNYVYKNIEFALKYTVSWGFHCELEIMVDNEQDVPNAVRQINTVASELGLKIMTDEELKEFTTKIETGWVRGQYSREEFESK